MKEDPLLQRLKSQIDSEAEAVRPLAPPWKRALLLFPLWALMVLAVLSLFGLRADYQVLGPSVAWSLAALQILLAWGLLFLGLRSVIPGMAVSAATTGLASSGALVLYLVFSWYAFQVSQVPGSR